jgi:mRNA-degrading endonuclease RelE of RelBE toxin-antitoxin system
VFRVEFDADAAEELDELRAYDRRQILGAIRNELVSAPTRRSRRKKILEGVIPPWDQAGPVWQLRIGSFRVFYDVFDDEKLVVVRAIRRKETETTEEIL